MRTPGTATGPVEAFVATLRDLSHIPISEAPRRLAHANGLRWMRVRCRSGLRIDVCGDPDCCCHHLPVRKAIGRAIAEGSDSPS